MQRYFLPVLLVALVSDYTSQALSSSALELKGSAELHRFVRVADHDHEGEEDEHGHGDPACPVTEENLIDAFNDVATETGLTGPDGVRCEIEEHGHEKRDTHEHEGKEYPLNLTCENSFVFARELLVHLNLSPRCCLEDGIACNDTEPEGSSRTGVSEAYGYGFLMVLVVSACPLLGLLVVPLLLKNSKIGQLYKYFYVLMIALGASALFCDAILHLIPEALGLHGHGHEEEEAHAEEEEEDQSFIGKGVVIIVGTYLFFLLETILHSLSPQQGHSSQFDSMSDTETLKATNALSAHEMEGVDANNGKIANGDTAEVTEEQESSKLKTSQSKNVCVRLYHYIRNIKPLAWLIIIGDGIHNFADGLALGAAIAQSLSLGLSTMIALIFHEIPHEIGDYVILISTGMTWYTALFFNLISALTAVLGFFVGVAISTTNEDATSWILAIAAGVFLYIALVDLLPELMHSKEKGCTRWLLFLMINIGFVISFIVLLILAIYEDQLNTLISV